MQVQLNSLLLKITKHYKLIEAQNLICDYDNTVMRPTNQIANLPTKITLVISLALDLLTITSLL